MDRCYSQKFSRRVLNLATPCRWDFSGQPARYQDPPGSRTKKGQHELFVLRTWLQAKFTKDERGASMVEYILLVALIALAVIAAVVFLRGQVQASSTTPVASSARNGS